VRVSVTDRQPFNGPTTVYLNASGTARIVGRELGQLLWCHLADEGS